MSVERHHENVERNEAAAAELEATRAEKLTELRENLETEDHADKRAEAAREVISKHEKPKHPEPTDAEAAPPEPKPHYAPALNPRQNYAHTMATLQRHLRPMGRRFSKLIHQPAVEKASEALERTVARPSILAGATWTALIVGAVFYFTARYYGYTLSGSELLFSFIVGGAIGALLELVFRAARHH